MIQPILPLMTSAEICLYDKVLSKTKLFCEFGSGSSTKYVLMRSVFGENEPISVISIESSREAVAALQKDPELASFISSGRLKIIHADIGPTVEWGYSSSADRPELWLNYTINLWPHLPKNIEVCMIDGRFRLATALLGLLYLPEATFMFHDFNTRAFYHALKNYINILEWEESLILYRLKTDFSFSDMVQEIFGSVWDQR